MVASLSLSSPIIPVVVYTPLKSISCREIEILAQIAKGVSATILLSNGMFSLTTRHVFQLSVALMTTVLRKVFRL